MIDPDHFFEGDTPEKTQYRRLALTMDIQARYAPLLHATKKPLVAPDEYDENGHLVSYCPMDDPTRERDYDILVKRQKAEMDQRFAEETKKPVVVPVEYDQGGHLIQHRSLSPNTFVFYIGAKKSICERPGCGEPFIKSKTRRKYCSRGCMLLAKTDSHTQKRREENNRIKKKN